MAAAGLKFLIVATLALAGGPAWAQGTVRVTEEPTVSQPPPFSLRGQTVVVPRTRIEIDEGGSKTRSGDPSPYKPAPEAEVETEAVPEAAVDPACPHSKILCGDPLRRRQPKTPDEIEVEAKCGGSKILCGDPLRRKNKN
jgi:hypothetical protein